MKKNIIKSALAVAVAGLTAYFNVLLIPLAILIFVMVCDWATGMAGAWINKSVSSRIGIIGIIKKVCYLFTVSVAMVADWIIQSALAKADIEVGSGLFICGMIVTIWLIINELISILENLSRIGVPLPDFLIKIVKKLKVTVENEVKTE